MKKLMFLMVFIIIVGVLYFKFPVFYCKFQYSNSYNNNMSYDDDILYLNYYDSGELSLQVPRDYNLILVEVKIYEGDNILWNKKYNKSVTKENFIENNDNPLPSYSIEEKLKLKKSVNLRIVLEYKENNEKKFFTSIYTLEKTRPYCNLNSGQ